MIDKQGGAVWQLFHDQFECEYKFKPGKNAGWICATMRKSCASVVKAERCPMKFSLTSVQNTKQIERTRIERIEARLDRLERSL